MMIGSIEAAVAALSAEDRLALLEKLESATIAELQAKAVAGKKKAAVERIAAARQGTLGERQALGLLEGALRRGGTSLDEIVAAPEKIDAIFAASRLSTDDRFAAKAMLYRLGVIGK
jgi:hypothetical protein